MFDFPSNPTLGQQFPVTPQAGSPVYNWDGEKWTAIINSTGAPPATVLPIEDGTAAVGTVARYAREDHVHPIGDALKRNVTATLTVGYTFTAYNLGNMVSFTPNPALGNYQYGNNTASITITAPAIDCAMDIMVTNSATAGVVTFSGFTSGNPGDALTTLSGSKFVISIRRIGGTAMHTIKALQL